MSKTRVDLVCPHCEKVYTVKKYFDLHVPKCAELQAKKKVKRTETRAKAKNLKNTAGNMTIKETMDKVGFKPEEETIFEPKNPNQEEIAEIAFKRIKEETELEESPKGCSPGGNTDIYLALIVDHLQEIKNSIKINTNVKKVLTAQLDKSLEVMLSFTEKIEAKEDRIFTQMGVMTTCMDLMMNSIGLLELANDAPEVKIVKVSAKKKELEEALEDFSIGEIEEFQAFREGSENPTHDDKCNCPDCVELKEDLKARKTGFGKKPAAFGKKKVGFTRADKIKPQPVRANSKPKQSVSSNDSWQDKKKETQTISVTIKGETEKAVLISTTMGQECWVPKSTIHGNNSFTRNADMEIEVDNWILKRNNVEV